MAFNENLLRVAEFQSSRAGKAKIDAIELRIAYLCGCLLRYRTALAPRPV